ncbi:recombinase family protein [Clostridium estertheticum]|uniref:recombinase family protein n=1 Tax=Clostridium estertheticum TaxID=238834 RepID=UPI0013E96D84|nr:recombinase family protein [Clostridium estertheticum]MBZ9684962.1 recombinase family protein [Clostridium estertheticum]
MKTAAIYTRKSKFTGKGESIGQQITACKEYLKRLDIDEHLIYEDEGYSGKSTDRPMYKKMIEDANSSKFSVIICYRLDRISRSVLDFSILREKLDKLEIDFISVSENFDTTTPMGRAMMGVSVVFSQLERESIGERIRDNMLELSKTGRWLGGTTPLGYKSEQVTFKDPNGKERYYFKLCHVPEEVVMVKDIYSKYLELKSMSQVVKYLLSNNMKTRNNTEWARSKISYILNNPVYVKATRVIVNFFEKEGVSVYGEPDGVHSILTYNKTKDKSGSKLKDPTEWVFAIANAEGIISDTDWLKAQNLLIENKERAPRMGKTNTALLTGLIRCAQCGGYMRVKYGGIDLQTKQRKFYYVCSLKYDSGHTRCQNNNADAILLETVVLNELKEICCDNGLLVERLKSYKNEIQKGSVETEIQRLTDLIIQSDLSIENLLTTLSLTSDRDTSKVILNRIETLNKQKKDDNFKIKELKESDNLVLQYQMNLDVLIQSYFRFSDMIDFASHEEKKILISSVVKRVYWDGKTKKVKLVLVGEDS